MTSLSRCSCALASGLLLALLALLVPDPARATPPTAAATGDEAPAPEGWDAFVADDANLVGLITAGSGLVGGLGVCALVALSPACCALPVGFPLAALTTGAGASVAAAVLGDWSCGRIWLPALAGTFLGATTGLFASVSGLIAWTILGSALGVSTFDPAQATASTLALVGAAGGTALLVSVLGSALTGVLVRFMFALSDERPRSRIEPPRRRAAKTATNGPGRARPREAFEY